MFFRYDPVNSELRVFVAVDEIMLLMAGSASPVTFDVVTSSVACRALSPSFLAYDVAAFEKFFGMVTTAAYLPDFNPASASEESVICQS